MPCFFHIIHKRRNTHMVICCNRGPQPLAMDQCQLSPVRIWAAEQKVGEQTKCHLNLQLFPITPINAWVPPPVTSAVALDSCRSLSLT